VSPSTGTVFENSLYTYNIKNIESVSIDLITPVSAMALPQAILGDAQNILVKAEGNTMRFVITWILHDADTSVVTADGGNTINSSRYGGSVDTADKQARFLTEDFQLKGVEYKYQIIIGDSNINRLGLIEKISLQKGGATPVTWKATLQFIAGDVVSIEN
jgi:hypothetical protein